MVWAMKCLWPTRTVVEQASGDDVFAQSHTRSLCGVALAVGQQSLSVVTSLFWRSAIVELSQFLTQASSSRGRRFWFPESRGQLCVWSKEPLVEAYVFSVVIGWSLRCLDVCVCTDASEKGFTFADREGCRELASEFSEQTRFKRSSRSIRARSRALRSILPEAGLECSSWDEDVMSLARRDSRADFPEVSVQLLDPSQWKLTACDSFFREEHIVVLEPLSIFYAVRYTARSKHFTLLSVMRRIFASGFRAGFVSPLWRIQSELNYSDEGSRFFDRDYDPSMSVLHFFAQRLTWSSPRQTYDRDCFSPSTLHLMSMCPQ